MYSKYLLSHMSYSWCIFYVTHGKSSKTDSKNLSRMMAGRQSVPFIDGKFAVTYVISIQLSYPSCHISLEGI